MMPNYLNLPPMSLLSACGHCSDANIQIMVGKDQCLDEIRTIKPLQVIATAIEFAFFALTVFNMHTV